MSPGGWNSGGGVSINVGMERRQQSTLFPEEDLILRKCGVRRDPQSRALAGSGRSPYQLWEVCSEPGKGRMCTIKAKCFKHVNDAKLYIP